jgi:hypothetical protein
VIGETTPLERKGKGKKKRGVFDYYSKRALYDSIP